MKILLSAYACEPNRGSEPGVGWNWAVELARLGHEVWVVTRRNNKRVISEVLPALPERDRVHFVYCDLPKWGSWWKRGGRGVYLYYLLWQWAAYRTVRKVHAAEKFDLVHHVTFVSARQPSFMGALGIPFVFGPVAGGERAPWRLRIGYGLRGLVLDAARDAMNFLVKIDPLMHYTFSSAARIYATSEQTERLIPAPYRKKVQVRLAIGSPPPESAAASCANADEFRILFVGRFLFWKGMHLGIRAFAKVREEIPNARLTMVGRGPDEKAWMREAVALGVDSSVEWVEWADQQALKKLYASHHVLLFPSLHDSGGMVVLEAMAHALPVVCLKLGGPGATVDDSCGRAVTVTSLTGEEVARELALALREIHAAPPARRDALRVGALSRVDAHRWDAAVSSLYQDLLQHVRVES